MYYGQLTDDVIIRLGEAQATLVAAYMPGDNSAVPVQTSQQIIQGWINDGQNDLSRNYYPVSDTGTYTWPAGQQFTRFTAFTCANNPLNEAFGVRKVNFGGVNLTSSGRAAAENWYPNMDVDPLGSDGPPRWYYEDGIEGFGVVPYPAASTAVTAKLIVIPAPLVLPTDVPQFPPDRHLLLSWYACAMCLLRNTEDPALQSRGTAYMNLYLLQAKNILSRVWRVDADFARDLMADNPTPPAAQQAGE